MSLCRTVSEIFSVKQWRYLEISVRGHSRSLKMVPFESLGTVSYSHSIAVMAVSLAVSTQYTNVTDTCIILQFTKYGVYRTCNEVNFHVALVQRYFKLPQINVKSSCEPLITLRQAQSTLRYRLITSTQPGSTILIYIPFIITFALRNSLKPLLNKRTTVKIYRTLAFCTYLDRFDPPFTQLQLIWPIRPIQLCQAQCCHWYSVVYLHIYGHFMFRHESTQQPSSRRILRAKLGVAPIFDISKTVLKVHQSPKQNKIILAFIKVPLAHFYPPPRIGQGRYFVKLFFPLYVILESRGLHHQLALASPVSQRCYMPRCKCKPRPAHAY